MTLLAFKHQLYTALKNHYPNTEIDSFFKLVLEDILSLSKIDFALNPHQKIEHSKKNKINKVIDELVLQKPIQQIIGFTVFMDVKLKINQYVLIPRPETEELINWIIDDYKNRDNTTILDIGTGSGCIPIVLSKNLKNATVNTIDVSKKAIEIAKKNAKINKVNIHFIHQNILTTQALNHQYDVIVSNPPYVRVLEKPEIQKNVLNYEPHLALFVNDNQPLVFYKKIAQLALLSLKPKGVLYFEINQYLGKETVTLLKETGFKSVTLKKDIFGNDRMIKATL